MGWFYMPYFKPTIDFNMLWYITSSDSQVSNPQQVNHCIAWLAGLLVNFKRNGCYLKFSFNTIPSTFNLGSILFWYNSEYFLDLKYLAIEQYFCRWFMLIITLCLVTSKANITWSQELKFWFFKKSTRYLSVLLKATSQTHATFCDLQVRIKSNECVSSMRASLDFHLL